MNDMTRAVAVPQPSALEGFLRGRLLAQLAPLRGGHLRLRDAVGDVVIGDPDVQALSRPSFHFAPLGGSDSTTMRASPASACRKR